MAQMQSQTQRDSQCIAVTFDFWNTLAAEQPGYMRGLRIDRLRAALRESGISVTADEVEIAVDSTVKRHIKSWSEGTQFVTSHAIDHALDNLGLNPEPAERKRIADAFSLESHLRVDLEPADGIGDVLDSLRSEGIRIGIVCDVGLTPSTVLRSFLDDHGLLGFFNGWSFSDEVGHYKPAPEIFAHALASLGGVEPHRAAHVGDLRRTDIAGAKSYGMRAIRYTGFHDDPAERGPEGDAVISSHSELFDVITG